MVTPRLEIFYKRIVCEDFIMLYNFTNINQLPKIERAILSSTESSFGTSKLSAVEAFYGWQISASQKGLITRARKSIALFNIRKEMLLGLKISLRRRAFFSFFDKLLTFALPQIISKTNNVTAVSSLPSQKVIQISDLYVVRQSPKVISKTSSEVISEASINSFIVSSDSALIFPEFSALSSSFSDISGFSLIVSFTGTKISSFNRLNRSSLLCVLQGKTSPASPKKMFLSSFGCPEKT